MSLLGPKGWFSAPNLDETCDTVHLPFSAFFFSPLFLLRHNLSFGDWAQLLQALLAFLSQVLGGSLLLMVCHKVKMTSVSELLSARQ